MNIYSAILLLAGGLVILWKSADILVDSAVGMAKHLGVSSLVIGLTVVAMGTSAPEVAASIAAAASGAGNLAIGNVYGSNIANLALVGGVASIICPIIIKKRTLVCDMPVMILAALILFPLFKDLYLGLAESLFLLGLFLALLSATVIHAGKNKTQNSDGKDEPGFAQKDKIGMNILFILVGLVGLAFGAYITVRGAVFMGAKIGLSDAVIGLTIVAIGTSLPELVTCVVASIKKHNDISIGNLVGSNIFNTLLVTGTAGTVRPFEVQPGFAGVDFLVMTAVTVLFAAMAAVNKKMSRVKGVVLVGCYLGYMVYLFAFTSTV